MAQIASLADRGGHVVDSEVRQCSGRVQVRTSEYKDH
jgi:hypothetical protein